MFDEKVLDGQEITAEDNIEISEPKNGGIKEWFKERKERRLAKKQRKEELHSKEIYSKGDAIRTTISTLAFCLLTCAALFCFGAVVTTALPFSLLIPVVKLAVCIGIGSLSYKMLSNSVKKMVKIRKARKKIQKPEKRKKKKEKKNKKAKTKKPNLFNRLKNRSSEDKPFVDFSEIENTEPEMTKTEPIIHEKETKKDQNFKTADILNVKLSKEYKNAKIKESVVNFVPGIGVYIYPVAKENEKEQKFFEAGYKAVYEEKPMSVETETHKVYILKQI